MATKKFVNDPKAAVEECTLGLLAANPNLRRVAGTHVIVAANYETLTKADGGQVALISGGGSGHEPAHAGYIGDGMLTAAVCGDVFASPPVSAVLAAIRTVCGPAGCLIIVKNYTGDRLNFGMAVEKATLEGYNCKIVVVADDCALPDVGIAGRRGLAGTVFVHKVAGATAAAGGSLEEVYNAASSVAGAIGTMGVALTGCTVPGAPRNTRLDAADAIEVGLGIHGEPGARAGSMAPASEIAAELIGHILGTAEPRGSPMNVPNGARLVLMVNGLGGTPPLELGILCESVLAQLRGRFVIERVLLGDFMTSLESCGASVTLFHLTDGAGGDAMLAKLDAPTTAGGWPAAIAKQPASSDIPKPTDPHGDAAAAAAAATADLSAEDLAGRTGGLAAIVEAVATALVDNEAKLTEWDQKVGDGDCGTAWRSGAEELRAAVQSGELLRIAAAQADAAAPLSWVNPALLTAVADKLAEAMGGTSGAICQIFFQAIAAEVKGGADIRAAVLAAAEKVIMYGGAQPGMRTLVDSLLPAAQALSSGASVTEAAAAALSGAEATTGMTAGAGRSSYVPEELLKTVPDPGAMAVAYCFEAIAKAV
uniref:Dihydroxyacetone kinase n=1 Tax=Phaeomonas parva TaxID=124430 RepID=A0A7S1UJS1_9STRA